MIAEEVRGLQVEWQRLHDQFAALHLILVEDRPARGQVWLIDQFDFAIEDASGWLRESSGELRALANASEGESSEHSLVSQHLGALGDKLQRLSRCYFEELASFERMESLQRFGVERKGEWLPWSRSALAAIGACRDPLMEATMRLHRCWRAATAGGLGSPQPCAMRHQDAGGRRDGRGGNPEIELTYSAQGDKHAS